MHEARTKLRKILKEDGFNPSSRKMINRCMVDHWEGPSARPFQQVCLALSYQA